MSTKFEGGQNIKTTVSKTQINHPMASHDAPQRPPKPSKNLDDLSGIDRVVVDKHLGQGSSVKKNRRNRHDKKQFIRNALTQRLTGTELEEV